MNDLLIGAIARYSPDKIECYVNSVNQCGFTGDKIMVVYEVPDTTIAFLQSNGWTVYGGSELTGHPHMARLRDICFLLRQLESNNYGYVITTDVRDVVFQTNPSKYIANNLSLYKKILASSENVNYIHEPWGTKNILEGYGPAMFELYKDMEICNVGVIAGHYRHFMDLMLLNYLVSQAGNTTHFTDQSSFNFVIHNQMVKDLIQIEGLDTNWALQIGTLDNDNLINVPRNKKYEIQIEGDKVMHSSGEPFVIVHQYDRNEKTKKLIEDKYRNA